MYVYRLCRQGYRALDGEGARLYGGRWNSPGRPVVYTSTSLALAALEYLVHLDPEDVPADLMAQTIEIPDNIDLETVDLALLPAGWERVPEPPACKAIGDAWVNAARVLALRVPAAPVPEERNVLLNLRHPGAAQVSIVSERRFFYDPRLLT